MNIEQLVVRVSIRPEFTRAEVQRDVDKDNFDHVSFSGYLQAEVLQIFQDIFSDSPKSRSWYVTEDLQAFVSLEAHGVASYHVGKLVRNKSPYKRASLAQV